MQKEFKYCENPEAETPRMFIDKEIGGRDADGLPNIDGNLFLKELMYLSDVLGKSKIEVWINSPGGLVTEGQSIYAAILESRATVDTICYGIAASIAGVIFQAGRKRIMLDFAHLMYHPAYSDDGRKDKGLDALNKSISTMIAKRSGKTEDEIWSIMNRGRMDDKGTWIKADEAKEDGFCDEVRNSDAKNKNSIESESVNSIWKSANKIYNRIEIKQQPIKMKNVFNKLGLIEDANETSVIAAIDILNKKSSDLQDQLDKKMKECDDLKAKIAETEKKNADDAAKAKADAEEADKAKAKADEDAKNSAADADLTAAVASGKIKNEATVIASYKAMYMANPALTKDLIEKLPATRTSPVFNKANVGEIKDNEAEAAARAAGLQPGTAKWYNAIASYSLQKQDHTSKAK